MPTYLSDQALAAQIRAAGFTGNDAIIAFAVAKAESGGATNKQSKPNNDGSVDRGLFQINSKAWPQFTNWNDPAQNAAFAHDVVLKQQGWRAWSTYKDYSYAKYLPDALRQFGTPAGTPQVNGKPPTGTQASTATTGDPSNRFAGIMSKSLWVRIGVGAAGALMLFAGWKIVNTKATLGI